MQRIVLLGASNLAVSFKTVVSLCCAHHGHDPLHIYTAMGYGRSYGNWSRFFRRKLPGILQCGIWDALDESQSNGKNRRTVALLTDFGNDLLYGSSPQELAKWVQTCVEKLQKHDAKIVLTLPPIESIQSLSRWRFFLFRTLFFPKATKSFSQLTNETVELDSQLRILAKSHSLDAIEPHKEWYGFDPIHIRSSRRIEAWQKKLDPILPDSQPIDFRPPWINGASRLRKTIRPAQAKYKGRFGKDEREVFVPQPCYETENLAISVF